VCGRYVQVSSPTLLAEHFAVDEVAVEPHEPDYNVAPRRSVYAVVQREPDRRVLEEMRWGLVPSWAKDLRVGDRLINARAETLADKPAYKRAFAKRRCILPADGFYEWQKRPRERGARARKQPMFIHRRDGEPLAFAGLWEAWRDPDDPDAPWVTSCVIVTTRANEVLAPVHDRMPVVLGESDWATWLDPGGSDPETLGRLLAPAPSEWFEVYPVSTAVNKPDNNSPDLVAPVDPDTLFQ
jgi:putative SOS response-associated peptidase YedK